MPKIINPLSNENLLLTIAIPTYKRPELLRSSLNSVVNQSYNGNYEIIILDNCIDINISREVDNIINSFSKYKKIHLYRNNSNIGMFPNWNKCLKKAKGKYISILNDDDLLDYEFVENVIRDIRDQKMLIYDYQILSEKKHENKIGGSFRDFLEKFNFVKKYEIKLSNIIYRNPSNGSLGVVFDRKNAILLGGYDKKNYPSSDYFFNYKYIQRFGGIHIKKKLAKYRLLVNESLKKESLINFVNLDYQLREEISLKYFYKNKSLYYLASRLNSLQACSQIARYIILRNCVESDFINLDIGVSKKIQTLIVNLILVSRYFCILTEIFILLTWKFIFFIK